MTPADIDRVFGRGRLRMVTGDHVEVFREAALPGERRRYTKRFLSTAAGDFRHWTEREWRILARLVGHGIGPVPDVVQYDRGVGGDKVALVQTYDAGITVDHWATLLPVRRAGQVLGHVFQDCAHWWALARHSLIALDAIHAIGLVHLDLKADNVCIPYEPAGFDPAAAAPWIAPRIEQIALIDFAFSHVCGEQLTRALPIARQTDYDYQSPRLLEALDAGNRGDLGPTRQLDWRCDLFSLAAMLRRYLSDPEAPPAHGWTPALDARARALVRRLLQAHDTELTSQRPHAELFTLASAPLADARLEASLESGWWLAPAGLDVPALSPTPVTRVAAPIVAQAAPAAGGKAEVEPRVEPPINAPVEPQFVADDRHERPADMPPRAPWAWAGALAAVALLAVPVLGDDWLGLRERGPGGDERPPAVPVAVLVPASAAAPTPATPAGPVAAASAPPAAAPASARPAIDPAELPVAAASAPPTIAAGDADDHATRPSLVPTLATAAPTTPTVPPPNARPAATPRMSSTGKRREADPRSAAAARAHARPAVKPAQRSGLAKLDPKRPPAAPARAVQPAPKSTTVALARPDPPAASLPRAPVTLPPAPVTLPPAPQLRAAATLPAVPATLPAASVTLPAAVAQSAPPAAQAAPRDHASRADELMAAELPRIAQRAERLVLPVLSAVAGAGDGDVRAAARTLRLAPGDPQLEAGASAADARALNEAARQALWGRGNLHEAVQLQTRAFGANPLDAEVAGNLAGLHLRQRPQQAETARQLALHALTLPDPRHPHGRIDDWTTLAVAAALAGREREARHAWWVSLELAAQPERQCRAALNAYAQYGERLRSSVEALLQRAHALGLDEESPQCAWPAHWRGRWSAWR